MTQPDSPAYLTVKPLCITPFIFFIQLCTFSLGEQFGLKKKKHKKSRRTSQLKYFGQVKNVKLHYFMKRTEEKWRIKKKKTGSREMDGQHIRSTGLNLNCTQKERTG